MDYQYDLKLMKIYTIIGNMSISLIGIMWIQFFLNRGNTLEQFVNMNNWHYLITIIIYLLSYKISSYMTVKNQLHLCIFLRIITSLYVGFTYTNEMDLLMFLIFGFYGQLNFQNRNYLIQYNLNKLDDFKFSKKYFFDMNILRAISAVLVCLLALINYNLVWILVGFANFYLFYIVYKLNFNGKMIMENNSLFVSLKGFFVMLKNEKSEKTKKLKISFIEYVVSGMYLVPMSMYMNRYINEINTDKNFLILFSLIYFICEVIIFGYFNQKQIHPKKEIYYSITSIGVMSLILGLFNNIYLLPVFILCIVGNLFYLTTFQSRIINYTPENFVSETNSLIGLVALINPLLTMKIYQLVLTNSNINYAYLSHFILGLFLILLFFKLNKRVGLEN